MVRIIGALAALPFLGACAEAPKPSPAPEPTKTIAPASGWRLPGITPYKIDIQQGNNVSPQAVAQLKTGMSKEQVRGLLGTPLLTSIFHAERWDYIYFREHPDGKREKRTLTTYFEDGKLVRVDGDVVAAQGAD